MVLDFIGTTTSDIGQFHVNEHNVIIGVVVRKGENNFSVCISGEVQLKLPFALNTTSTQPVFLSKNTGLISLFASIEQGNTEKVIGFLYGCQTDIDEEGQEIVISRQSGDLHPAFVEI